MVSQEMSFSKLVDEPGLCSIGHNCESSRRRLRPRKILYQLTHSSSNNPVRPIGVEPITYGSEDHCSIQLSYGRGVLATGNLGDSRRWLKGTRGEVASSTRYVANPPLHFLIIFFIDRAFRVRLDCDAVEFQAWVSFPSFCRELLLCLRSIVESFSDGCSMASAGSR